MEVVMQEVHLALARAADNMAHFYDAHFREAPMYAVRDKVWLNGQNITTMYLMNMDHRWIGLYAVGRSSHEMLIGTSYLLPSAELTPSSQLLYYSLQCRHHHQMSIV